MQNHYFGGSNPPVASNLALGMVLVLAACRSSDAPTTLQSFIEWRSAAAPVERPLAVFVDQVGGPLDLLARDPDMTTFLNDKFTPLLVPGFGDQRGGTAALYSADGCLLAPPFVPESPQAWIGVANQVIGMPEASGRTAPFASARDCR